MKGYICALAQQRFAFSVGEDGKWLNNPFEIKKGGKLWDYLEDMVAINLIHVTLYLSWCF